MDMNRTLNYSHALALDISLNEAAAYYRAMECSPGQGEQTEMAKKVQHMMHWSEVNGTGRQGGLGDSVAN